MKLKSKLLIFNMLMIIFIGIVIFALIYYNNKTATNKTLSYIETTLINDRKTKLEDVVNMVYYLLDGYYKQYGGDEEKIKKAMRDAVLKMRYEDGNNYVWIHRVTDSFVVLHPSKKIDQTVVENLQDAKGKYIFKEFNKVASTSGEGFVDYYWPKLGEEESQPKLSFVKIYKPLGWVIGSGIYIDDVKKEVNVKKKELLKDFNKMMIQMIIFLVGAIALLILVTILLANKLFKPIQFIYTKIKEIAAGGSDLTKRLDIKSKDEIGLLTIEFNKFLDFIESLIVKIKKQSLILKEQVENVSATIEETSASMKEMDSSFESVKNTLKIYSDNLVKNSKALKIILEGIQKAKSGYEKEDNELTRLSAAIEELNANAQSVTNNSKETQNITKNLLEISNKGKTSLEDVFKHVEGIKKDAEKIKNTTTIIEDIADKTNLLSMNAAIEAAHAGDAGKGFAVVADEIRKLAENSGTNSKEINKSLDEVVKTINETSDKSKLSSDIFEQIFEKINQTEIMISEVAESMTEESEAINDMLKSMKTIMDVVNDNLQNNESLVNQSRIIEQANENLMQVSQEIKVANEEQSLGIKNLMFALEEMNKLSLNLVNVNNELEQLINKFKISENFDKNKNEEEIYKNSEMKKIVEKKD